MPRTGANKVFLEDGNSCNSSELLGNIVIYLQNRTSRLSKVDENSFLQNGFFKYKKLL